MITTRKLGREGHEFMIESIPYHGFHGLLGSAILRRQDLMRGTIVAHVSDAARVIDADAIRYGGITSSRECLRALVEMIVSYLLDFPQGLGLVKDMLGRPSDPCVQAAELNKWLCDDEVYYPFCQRDLDGDYIQRAIRKGRGAVDQLGVLLPANPAESMMNGEHEISPHVIAEIGTTADMVFFAAFDGEGYLIWTREGILA